MKLKDKKYNYVYRITNIKENKHYIGVRSCNIEPYEDIGKIYQSTSKNEAFKQDQKDNPQDYLYQILEFFDTRLEANEYEVHLHKIYNVGCNPNFYNRSNQTSKFFDNTGNKEIGAAISKANKGRIVLNNGINKIIVIPTKVNYYIELGFKIGGLPHKKETRDLLSCLNSGKITLTNGLCEISVKQDEVDEYRILGFREGGLPMREIQKFKLSLAHSGKILTEEHKENISKSTKGSTKSETMKSRLSDTRKGMIYINNNSIEKIIPSFELYEYIEEGWNEGKLPMPEHHKEAISKGSIGKSGTTTGKIRINNGEIEKFILKDELEHYTSLGWSKGNNSNRKAVDYSNRKGTTSGKIGINNGVYNKFILESELSNYLSDGWCKGSKSTKKHNIII